ncbi:unnamed protein product [Hymenolepis diminuta]|uniref:Uncharacterized protein n=1 Tax=Hymenolepis diminuta TaxID=6216 RepID=A0A564XYJ9_HYMDI|nr:unnamed protein product [Hymenolepis diminuta]
MLFLSSTTFFQIREIILKYAMLYGLREFCKADVDIQTLRIIKETDEVLLKNLRNECMTVGMKYNSGRNPQSSGESSYLNWFERISGENVFQNVFYSLNP